MRLVICLGLMVVLAARAALAQVPEALVVPPGWPVESTYEFAILDQGGARVATAYYRILQTESEGRPVYQIKYVGRNELTSEASECWVHRDSLLPLRSTRKLVTPQFTLYQDVAYGQGFIVIRRKYEGQEVVERELPVGPDHYDYEELIWIIPYLDFQGESRTTFSLFSAIHEKQAKVVITDVGIQQIDISGNTYDSHLYAFDLNMEPYMLWTVMQDGVPVPAKITIGSTTFLNIRLDPKKAGTLAGNRVPETPQQAPPPTQDPEQEPENPPPASDNPLGPPPPGSRF